MKYLHCESIKDKIFDENGFANENSFSKLFDNICQDNCNITFPISLDYDPYEECY